jgi:[acyl-carrier-protein] S-malonyltransferase
MIEWTKTALLFPGQGSQVVGMGKAMAEKYPAAMEIFTTSDEVYETEFTRLCFEGPQEELDDTYNTQPSMFVVGMAVFTALNAELSKRGQVEARPAFMAGHSLGEFTALVCAKAIDYRDGLRLVRRRAWLMHEAGEHHSGGMAAVIGSDVPTIEAICQEATDTTGKPLVLANDNTPGQHVISGDVEALELAMKLAKERGIRRVVRIPVSVAAHSPLMAEASEAFNKAVQQTPIQPPRIPVIGNAKADVLPDEATIREELNAQLAHRLRWTESIQMMVDKGVTTFIELGPKGVLTRMMRHWGDAVTAINVETPEDIETLLEN